MLHLTRDRSDTGKLLRSQILQQLDALERDDLLDDIESSHFYLSLRRPAAPLRIAPLRPRRVRYSHQRAESPVRAGTAGVGPPQRRHMRPTMDHPSESAPGQLAPVSLARYRIGCGRFRVHFQ